MEPAVGPGISIRMQAKKQIRKVLLCSLFKKTFLYAHHQFMNYVECSAAREGLCNYCLFVQKIEMKIDIL
jgi:hypothetical protein